MTLAELLDSLFPEGHDIANDRGVLRGWGSCEGCDRALVIGMCGRTAVGVDEALRLSRYVLDSLALGGAGPIIVLVDSASQRMSKRDELLGLHECLAHLAKCLIYADLRGHPTVGVLYGHSAAGAFLATALAARSLVALPGADPAVMDLPSMSKVTKPSIEILQQKAESTAVFAPGLENLARTGAVFGMWDEDLPLADQLAALLARARATDDRRDRLGKIRKGRLKAADIAERVYVLAHRVE
jgi:malonate decarboxylase gamma subunit